MMLWTFTLYCGRTYRCLSQTLADALRQYHEANPGLPFEVERIRPRVLTKEELVSWVGKGRDGAA